MHLTLQSQCIAGVAVIRCQGRIVVGTEVGLLQQEVEKHRLETQKYVLQLAEVNYLDSGGLGAMVRLVGMLRAYVAYGNPARGFWANQYSSVRAKAYLGCGLVSSEGPGWENGRPRGTLEFSRCSAIL